MNSIYLMACRFKLMILTDIVDLFISVHQLMLNIFGEKLFVEGLHTLANIALVLRVL